VCARPALLSDPLHVARAAWAGLAMWRGWVVVAQAPGRTAPADMPGSSCLQAVQMAVQPPAGQSAAQQPYAAAAQPLQPGVHSVQGAYADPTDPGAVELPQPGFADAGAAGPPLDALMAAGQLQEHQQMQQQPPPHEHEQEPQPMQP
jgi:hypothetical protein